MHGATVIPHNHIAKTPLLNENLSFQSVLPQLSYEIVTFIHRQPYDPGILLTYTLCTQIQSLSTTVTMYPNERMHDPWPLTDVIGLRHLLVQSQTSRRVIHALEEDLPAFDCVQ
ncbi:hypothetical protein D3C76_1061440 [compost metagenome]